MDLNQAQTEIRRGLKTFEALKAADDIIAHAIASAQLERETQQRIEKLKADAIEAHGVLSHLELEAFNVQINGKRAAEAAEAEAAAIVAKAREQADRVIAGAKAEAAVAARAVSDAKAEVASLTAMAKERSAEITRLCSEESAVSARIAKAHEAARAVMGG